MGERTKRLGMRYADSSEGVACEIQRLFRRGSSFVSQGLILSGLKIFHRQCCLGQLLIYFPCTALSSNRCVGIINT